MLTKQPSVKRPIFINGDGSSMLRGYRQAIRGLVQEFPDITRLAFAHSFTAAVTSSYWNTVRKDESNILAIPPLPANTAYIALTDEAQALAQTIGVTIALLDPINAGFQIGEIYTTLLPVNYRATQGVYYTPPALGTRLLDLATAAGVDWPTAHVLDPACGGGAFLTLVTLRIRDALTPCAAPALLDHLSRHVRGFEIDTFGAWLSQALLEAALLDIAQDTGLRLPSLVTVCNALEQIPTGLGFDLVIGNPPYGRVGLAPYLRAQYKRSLYGHANLYGIFTDLAIRWAKPGGVIAYVTPTSFLGGEYFKALRRLLATEAPPSAIDLVTDRKGVFADVLQETLLATYRRGRVAGPAPVHVLYTIDETKIIIEPAGMLTLPTEPTAPWSVPRAADQAQLVARMKTMPHRLADYGYQVSTGPLVWNRHKAQLSSECAAGAFPVIWAESVTADGRFVYRAAKKNHVPFFLPKVGDDWLLTSRPCVLVQRTTAKEQRRRLIAAELPKSFIRTYGAVAVENHLNMIRPGKGSAIVSPRVLAALLNSSIIDTAFRCSNGSVAVSASELAALPLPDPASLPPLAHLIETNAPLEAIECLIERMYLGETAAAPEKSSA